MNFSKLSLTKAAGGRAAGRGEEDRGYRPLEESPLNCYAYIIVTVNVEGPGAGDPGGFCEAGVLDWEEQG